MVILHKDMVGKGFSPTASSYNALMKGFYKRKKFSEANQLFEKMRSEGLDADREIYNIFADINYDEGKMELTLELCDVAIEKCLVGDIQNKNTQLDFVSPMVPLAGVLMITNKGYWLLMVRVELNNRLELIKHQMKIIQAKDLMRKVHRLWTT